MNYKACDNCKKIYTSGNFTTCPDCNTPLREVTVEDNKTDNTDKEFRIEYNPGEKKSLHEDIKGLIVITGVFLFLFIILAPWALISFIILYANIKIVEMPSLSFIFLFLFCILFLIVSVLSLKQIFKQKSLMKKGIILKNLKYTVINRINVGERNTSLIRVKIDYTAEDGTTHVFKGILPDHLTKGDLCDVLVDTNNYKKHIVRYFID